MVKVKVGEGNVRSLGLFRSLGFRRVEGEEEEGRGVSWFGEVEMRLEGGLEGVKGGGMEGYRELEYVGGGDGVS